MAVPLCTPVGRVRFHSVWQPNKREKYTLCLVLRPELMADSEKLKFTALVTAVNEIARSTFQVENVKKLGDRGNPFNRADDDSIFFQPGDVILNMASKFKVSISDIHGHPLEGEEQFYKGCYARALVLPKAYNVDGSKGITLYLNGIQKMRDGERIQDTDPTAIFQDSDYDLSHLPEAPARSVPDFAASESDETSAGMEDIPF